MTIEKSKRLEGALWLNEFVTRYQDLYELYRSADEIITFGSFTTIKTEAGYTISNPLYTNSLSMNEEERKYLLKVVLRFYCHPRFDNIEKWYEYKNEKDPCSLTKEQIEYYSRIDIPDFQAVVYEAYQNEYMRFVALLIELRKDELIKRSESNREKIHWILAHSYDWSYIFWVNPIYKEKSMLNFEILKSINPNA